MPTVTKHTSNNLVTVSYPVREAVLEITHAEHALILAFSHEKVKMVKFIRAQYNLGLYEAKQVVDTVISTGALPSETHQVKGSSTNDETDWTIDWSTMPEGTRVCVRDHESRTWVKCELIKYCADDYYKFLCTDNLEGSMNWKYAKLDND